MLLLNTASAVERIFDEMASCSALHRNTFEDEDENSGLCFELPCSPRFLTRHPDLDIVDPYEGDEPDVSTNGKEDSEDHE